MSASYRPECWTNQPALSRLSLFVSTGFSTPCPGRPRGASVVGVGLVPASANLGNIALTCVRALEFSGHARVAVVQAGAGCGGSCEGEQRHWYRAVTATIRDFHIRHISQLELAFSCQHWALSPVPPRCSKPYSARCLRDDPRSRRRVRATVM